MEEPISDKSNVNISLPFLIQAVIGIASLVWMYANLTSAIMAIQNRLDSVEADVKANFEWRESWESGGILPLDVSQNEKIAYLEKEVERLRNKYGD